jgi:hypothetical protein
MTIEPLSVATSTLVREAELSPADEIRAIREAISARFGNDVDRVSDHATAVAAQLKHEQLPEAATVKR